MDWCKIISRLSLDKGNKLKGGHGGSPREMYCVYVRKERKRMMKCEEVLNSYVWRNAHGKGVCKDQT